MTELTTMIEVFIEGLEFYGYHGVPEAERQVGHRYRIDINLHVDSQAENTDNIEDTADYAKIGVELVRFGENQQYKTLERLAHEMATAVLKSHPKVENVEISVRKMLPPAPFIAESCGVTLELSR
jgi:dihydroneopterin aldolase